MRSNVLKRQGKQWQLFGEPVFLLIFIAFISHFQWFNPFSILSSGDWYHWTDEAVKELHISWGSWINYVNFGMVNVQLPFNWFMVLWSLIVNTGRSFDAASKLIIFIPIAVLSFLSPYVLARKLVGDKSISFVAALFYGTTTYALINQVPIQFVYALSPLIFYFFILALEKNRTFEWIVFSLIYWISISYEIRITYIVTFILLFYFVFFYWAKKGRYVKNIILSSILILGLNFFWMLPSLFGPATQEISSITSRGLFGDNLFSIPQSFTIFTWNWTGGRPDDQFRSQPISWYFWLMPILLTTSLLFKKDPNRKQILFFWTVSLVGILLTKQSGKPFLDLYSFLYQHFPGFSLFREASKFYVVTAIGYVGLLSFALLHFKEKRFFLSKQKDFSITTVLSIILIGFFLWNLSPLVDGSAQGLFISKNVHQDYTVVSRFIAKNEDFFRTLWVPVYSRWSYFDNTHPQIGLIYPIGSEWKDILTRHSKAVNGSQLINIFLQPFSDQLLDLSSVKYVFVPIRDIENDDDFFKDYGKREFFVDELDKLSYLRRIDIGTEDLVVYENEDYRPHIYETQEKETIRKEIPFEKTDFQFNNPTEYSIKLKDITTPLYINFSEKYHPDWKVRIGEFRWFDVLTKKDYFLSDYLHSENDAKLNSFLIDPAYIQQNFPKDVYVLNPDGSLDLDLTLYFKPQSYFYLGVIISGTTLTGCLGYLGYVGIRSWRRRQGS